VTELLRQTLTKGVGVAVQSRLAVVARCLDGLTGPVWSLWFFAAH